MNRISTLLDPYENVVLDLDVISRKRLFEEAAAILSTISEIDKQQIFDGFIAREKLGSTALPCGIAIPHARLASISAPIITLIRTKDAIDYSDSAHSKPRLFLAMLVPKSNSEEYLPLLSQVAAFCNDPQHIQDLLATDTALNACRIVESWTPE